MRPLRIAALCALACSACHATAAPRSVALVGLTGGAGYDARTVGTVEELLLVALQRTKRLKITGQSDIARLVGFERQRQMLGCQDFSCLAEIAGALGVDYVASADLGRLGEIRALSLKLIDVRTAEVVVRVARRVTADEEIAEAIDEMAKEAAALLEGVPRSKNESALADPAVGVPAGSIAAADGVPFLECGGNYRGVGLFALCDRGRLHGAQLGGIAWARTTGDVVGAQGALFYARTGGHFRGLAQGALLGYASIGGSFAGLLQGAPASRIRGNFSGFLQACAWCQVGGRLAGWQLGLWNRAHALRGFQLGAANFATTTAGGLQLGIFNRAEEVRGVQAGLVNVARRLRGVQLGVANYAADGRIPFTVLVNAGW